MSHLVIKLGGLAVGDLRRRSGDSWELRFREGYIALPSRPVLGQFFEDDLQRTHRSTLLLPPFFSNLLPEGPLRELLARHARVNEQREALLLEVLGGDLPGAVIVEHGDGGETVADDEPPPSSSPSPDRERRLKFSLAGVQLKLSVLQKGDRLTLPVAGQGGDWIVKLPDARFPGVPANEISMLQWARRAGIQVPDHRIVHVSEIDGLPREIGLATETDALAVRRFDREAGRRIHQEDLAQVLGLYPHEKYDQYNYETIGNIIHAVAGPEALIEYARRLTFVVLSGNGDAHHKNWSLLYPDGRTATLTPAYDQVFTRAYMEGDELALKLRGSRRFDGVTLESFRHLARKCGFDEDRLANAAADAAQRIREAWKEIEPEMPMAPEMKAKLRRHLERMHL